MKTLKSVNELLSVIGDNKKEIILTTYTDPKLAKTGNPYIGIKKINVRQVAVNFNYVNDVNVQRLKEGKDLDFIPKSRTWGERLNNTCIIQHNNQQYIECEIIKDIKKYYIDENREMIPEDQLKDFLPKKYNTQNLENPIKINTYKLSNVKEINVDGIDYIVSIQ